MNLIDSIYRRASPQIEIDSSQLCRSLTSKLFSVYLFYYITLILVSLVSVLSIVFDATYRAALKAGSVVAAVLALIRQLVNVLSLIKVELLVV